MKRNDDEFQHARLCDLRLHIEEVTDILRETESQPEIQMNQQTRPISPARWSPSTQEDPEDVSRQRTIATLHKKPKMNSLWVQVPSPKMEQQSRPQTPEPHDKEAKKSQRNSLWLEILSEKMQQKSRSHTPESDDEKDKKPRDKMEHLSRPQTSATDDE